jgi:transcriptional regulator
MYIPEPYAVADRDALHGVIRENNFGLLVNQVEGAPFATHLPFLIEGDVLVSHMASANPQWRSFAADREVLCIFQGPHAYISPRWYESSNTVPTWNYVAVHVHGVPEIIADPAAALADQVLLVAAHESGFAEPWSLAERDPGMIDGLLRAIVNFRIPIGRIEGKFKLGQNKTAADRAGAIAALEESGDPTARALAALMRT